MYSCNAQQVGNNICQDECGIDKFDYDQFDCCLEFVNVLFCEDCICHMDGTRHFMGTEECGGWNMGDGVCDDGCNKELYEYDHGDCCLPVVNSLNCKSCYCHQDMSVHPSHDCRAQYIGDKVCHEACNQEATQFDAGDCCLPHILDFFCIDCICHQEGDTISHYSSRIFSLLLCLLVTKYLCRRILPQ